MLSLNAPPDTAIQVLNTFAHTVHDLRWILAFIVAAVLVFLWLEEAHRRREAQRQAAELASEVMSLRARLGASSQRSPRVIR